MDPFDRPLWKWLTSRPAWVRVSYWSLAVFIILVS
jgi:hypothetical protein